MHSNPATVANDFSGRVRLAFARHPFAVVEPDETPAAPKLLEIELIAYAEDCILSGRLPLAAERLSDLLNDNVEFELVDVMVEDLVGGRPIEVRDTIVRRDELLLVQATSPRGNPGRRRSTQQHPIVAKIGPYKVRGLVHALPGNDPIESLRGRKPMVALTDVVIEYSIGTDHHRRRAEVVIMNRECVDWIVEGHDETAKAVNTAAGGVGQLHMDFRGE
jgi:hypothetical protein